MPRVCKASFMVHSRRPILSHGLVHISGSSLHIPSFTRNPNSTFTLLAPPVERRWDYQVYKSEHEVQDVLEEYEDLGELQYLVRFSNGHESEVSGSLQTTHQMDVKQCWHYNSA